MFAIVKEIRVSLHAFFFFPFTGWHTGDSFFFPETMITSSFTIVFKVCVPQLLMCFLFNSVQPQAVKAFLMQA